MPLKYYLSNKVPTPCRPACTLDCCTCPSQRPVVLPRHDCYFLAATAQLLRCAFEPKPSRSARLHTYSKHRGSCPSGDGESLEIMTHLVWAGPSIIKTDGGYRECTAAECCLYLQLQSGCLSLEMACCRQRDARKASDMHVVSTGWVSIYEPVPLVAPPL